MVARKRPEGNWLHLKVENNICSHPAVVLWLEDAARHIMATLPKEVVSTVLSHKLQNHLKIKLIVEGDVDG